MPKRSDLKTILIIGAGPIVIGQACEFDYSGAQACKALRDEGYRVVLVNSNPATIMTDPEMADAMYIEPINWQTVEKIIAKEKPDALLPTLGGQTALNCALDLADNGVLEKYGVELIGAKREAIRMAEDRQLFKDAWRCRTSGWKCPKAAVAHTLEEAMEIQTRVGYPTIIRPSFTMGGSGGGIAYNREELIEIVNRGLHTVADHRGAARGIGPGLEGVRDGAGARHRRQHHHGVLDRERRPDGRAHRRLDHGRPGAHLDRQGIPAPARHRHRGHAQDRAWTPAAATSSSPSTRRPAAWS